LRNKRSWGKKVNRAHVMEMVFQKKERKEKIKKKRIKE